MRLLLAALITLALAAPASAVDSSARIVGGGETQADWPFMVYLENGRQEIELFDSQFCAGTLIAPTWVVTAAHCLTTLEIVDPLVLVAVQGRHARSDTDSGQRIQARRVIQHPDYASATGNDHDVMLVELERAATDTPVKIAGSDETGLWAPGAAATILGWGATSEGGSGSDVLKEAQVPIVSDSSCAASYDEIGGFHAPTMVCAGYPQGGTDTCQGDSGGPMLVSDGAGGWRQVGVTSWGEGCAQAGFPGVYSEVAGDTLRAWIASHVPGAIATTRSSAPPAPAPAPAPPPSSPAPQPSPQPAPASSEPASEKRTAKRAKRRRACKSRRTRKARRACRKHRRAAARRRTASRG